MVRGRKYDDVLGTEKTEKPNIKASSEKHQTFSVNVYESLECPVCTNLMSAPIFQCPNGHPLCSFCKIKVKSVCPLCRIDMGNMRSLALEKVAKTIQLPYTCPYSSYKCCSVNGDISELLMHLKDDHKLGVLNIGVGFKHSYAQLHEEDNATGMLHVLNFYGKQFCYHFEDLRFGSSQCYLAFLRFMGEDTEAQNFNYSLEIGGSGRKLTWQGVPTSIRDSHQKVCDSLDGLLIPRNSAPFYSDGNEEELKLQVYGRIWIK